MTPVRLHTALAALDRLHGDAARALKQNRPALLVDRADLQALLTDHAALASRLADFTVRTRGPGDTVEGTRDRVARAQGRKPGAAL